MFYRGLIYFGGLFYFLSCLTMLIGPIDGFKLTLGVSETGPANHHFIIDAALAYAILNLRSYPTLKKVLGYAQNRKKLKLS